MAKKAILPVEPEAPPAPLDPDPDAVVDPAAEEELEPPADDLDEDEPEEDLPPPVPPADDDPPAPEEDPWKTQVDQKLTAIHQQLLAIARPKPRRRSGGQETPGRQRSAQSTKLLSRRKGRRTRVLGARRSK